MVAIADNRRAARRRASDLLAEKTMTCNELPRPPRREAEGPVLDFQVRTDFRKEVALRHPVIG
jgi:hypothetical protein